MQRARVANALVLLESKLRRYRQGQQVAADKTEEHIVSYHQISAVAPSMQPAHVKNVDKGRMYALNASDAAAIKQILLNELPEAERSTLQQ